MTTKPEKTMYKNFLLFGMLIVGYAWGRLSFELMNISMKMYTKDKDCTDTTCFVQVMDGNCFAKFANLIDPTLHSVKCDIHREGNYNTTLSCNYKKESSAPVLRCTYENTEYGKYTYLVLMILLSPFTLFIAYAFIFIIYLTFIRKKYLSNIAPESNASINSDEINVGVNTADNMFKNMDEGVIGNKTASYAISTNSTSTPSSTNSTNTPNTIINFKKKSHENNTDELSSDLYPLLHLK